LLDACIDGLVAGGAEVIDLGLCGTEEMYFVVTPFEDDGGIEVTASQIPRVRTA
jgi:phosphomannomutase